MPGAEAGVGNFRLSRSHRPSLGCSLIGRWAACQDTQMADQVPPRKDGAAVASAATETSPRSKGGRGRRWWPRLVVFAVLVDGSGGSAVWYLSRPPGLPAGIDTKFAGRISATLVDEGDLVREGQAVARSLVTQGFETVEVLDQKTIAVQHGDRSLPQHRGDDPIRTGWCAIRHPQC